MVSWYIHLSIVRLILQFIELQYQLFWVLIYFDDTLLDRSDGWEDMIVVTEEGVKEVIKPHTEVSPVQLCVVYIASKA